MSQEKEITNLPEPSEVLITDVGRIKYLLKAYLKRPSKKIRARDESFAQLFCDPSGYVWGMVIPESGPGIFRTPYLRRCKSYLVGDDNLEVKQPVI
ncbi:hypothetical protein [Undibacterium umbellatum]|uniref:Uncharacterized protein n=1 Tax=Undibacterium umbellatum TaxID=2762300 RepID=A0ABR6Z6E1_9BURK|nr:hypothetical protein [Undibacterium umbellatum]MBC3907310.1 hypothetical protein [Undibacterium umbellatum]